MKDLLYTLLMLFCVISGLAAVALAAIASLGARSARTAEMNRAWVLIALLAIFSWVSIATSCFGIVTQHLKFVLSGGSLFGATLLLVANGRFRSFLTRAAERENRAAR